MLKACGPISGLFTRGMIARRGHKSISSAVKEALVGGYQKIIMVSGREGMQASIIKIMGPDGEYAWQR